jgi:hypothetical protein
METSYFAIVLATSCCLCIRRLQQVRTSKLSLHFDIFKIIVCAWGSLKLHGDGDSQPWTATIVGEVQVFFLNLLIFVKTFGCLFNDVFANDDEIDELKKEQKTLTIGFLRMAHPQKKPRCQRKVSGSIINNK